jgi:hypothetical protein
MVSPVWNISILGPDFKGPAKSVGALFGGAAIFPAWKREQGPPGLFSPSRGSIQLKVKSRLGRELDIRASFSPTRFASFWFRHTIGQKEVCGIDRSYRPCRFSDGLI